MPGPGHALHTAQASPQGQHRVHTARSMLAGPGITGSTGGQSRVLHTVCALDPLCYVQHQIQSVCHVRRVHGACGVPGGPNCCMQHGIPGVGCMQE